MMLKMLCAEYVNLQENLSNKDKITFLKFLKECNHQQASHLLLYGEMVSLSSGKLLLDKRNRFVDYNTKADPFGGGSFSLGDIEKAHSTNPLTAIKAAYRVQGAAGAKVIAQKFLPHALIVAAIITASIVLYKKYMTKAARACRGVDDKSSCMIQYKMKAYGEQIKKLKMTSGLCKKSKNPDKCTKKIMGKINSINQKIQKQKSKL